MDTSAAAPPDRPTLSTVVGPHAFLEGLRARAGQLETVELALDESHSPTNRAFRAMAERQAFDVCEIALATYVQARAAGQPITLLPVTLVGRFQHAQLVHDAASGDRRPSDLACGRVGVRSYSQTTGVWVRSFLRTQYGVDLDSIEWIVFEEPHVRGFELPPNVVAAEEGEDLWSMLETGRLDAAIGTYPGENETISPLIDDTTAAAAAWYEETGVVPINHVLSVRESLVEEHPAVIRSIYEHFRSVIDGRAPTPATEAAGGPDVDTHPAGYGAVSPSLRLVAEEVARQHLIPRPLSEEELVHPFVRGLT